MNQPATARRKTRTAGKYALATASLPYCIHHAMSNLADDVRGDEKDPDYAAAMAFETDTVRKEHVAVIVKEARNALNILEDADEMDECEQFAQEARELRAFIRKYGK